VCAATVTLASEVRFCYLVCTKLTFQTISKHSLLWHLSSLPGTAFTFQYTTLCVLWLSTFPRHYNHTPVHSSQLYRMGVVFSPMHYHYTVVYAYLLLSFDLVLPPRHYVWTSVCCYLLSNRAPFYPAKNYQDTAVPTLFWPFCLSQALQSHICPPLPTL
jgi:hypothetical protein